MIFWFAAVSRSTVTQLFTHLHPIISLMMAAANDFQAHQEDNALVVVYFDLETSGFGSHSEILQIAAMFGDCTFSVYINPQFGIPPRVSAVNGFTECQGNLLLNDIPVSSVSLQTGLMQFHSFLISAGRKCVLTAHNWRIRSVSLNKSYRNR